MSAAAQAVSLSQPALTQGLAKLEAQLGVALFERLPDGVRPTADGVVLAERAQAAFAHLAAAARLGARGFLRPEQLMTATQLRAFLATATLGGFAGASAATGLSQPALHRAVRDLEQICGVALAERRGRGVVPTAAGQRLARGTRLAERELEAALAEIAERSGAPSDRIAIGAMPLSRAELLPRAVARLVRAMPHVTVDVVDGSWAELIEPLRDGVIDLMIGALRPEVPAELRQEPLLSAELVIVARAGHPLAAVANPTREQLAAYPWIVGRRGTPLRGRWEGLFAGMDFPPAPIACGSVTMIRGILRESDCLTLLSPGQFAHEAETGLLARIGGSYDVLNRVIGIASRADWRPGSAGRRFVELLHEAAAELE